MCYKTLVVKKSSKRRVDVKAVQWMMMMMMTVCCAVTVLRVEGRLDVNVALNRPSYQSGTKIDGEGIVHHAGLSNDGSRSNSNWDFCSVTRVVQDPWWAVDLAICRRSLRQPC